MMNKINYIMLCLVSCFAFMNSVFAEGELSFSIDPRVVGGNTVVKGGEATVNVSLVSDVAISSCTFNIVSDEGIEFVSKSQMVNNFKPKDEGNNIIIENTSTDNSFNSGQNVLELKYKVNNDGKLTIKTLECKSVDDKTGTIGDNVIEFKTVDNSDDTSLSNLTVTGGTLSTNFSSNVYNYTVQLHNTKFSLNMTASNSEYQDKIVVTDVDGNVLDPKEIVYNSTQSVMPITITVNGVTKYNLGVNYEQTELDGSLASVKVDDKEIELESGKYEYSVNVGKNVTEVKIEAVLKDSDNFKFVNGDGITIFQIPSATNVYPIMIEPKDSSTGGKSGTYFITINREGMSSNGNQSSTGGNSEGSGSSSSNSQGNAITNPSTGGISMFLMAFVLIASLIGSIYLYKKNLEGYNQ